mgnify:CR=1 FL=1
MAKDRGNKPIPTQKAVNSNTSTKNSLVLTVEHAEVFDLATASDLTGLHQEMILEFCRSSLVPLAAETATEPSFDERGICRLRQIAELRNRQNVNLRTVRLIVRLLYRLENAETELRFLREHSS